MPTALTDFLKEKAIEIKDSQKEKHGIIVEWKEAVQQLLDEIRVWLRDADPDGLLSIEQDEWEVTEEKLGRYSVPRLDIKGLGRSLAVIPKSRYVVATSLPNGTGKSVRGTGRVDLTWVDSEAKRYHLYRFPGDGSDIWMIDDRKSIPSPLNRERFEAALMSLLK